EALEDEVGEVRLGGDEEIGPLAAGEHDELVDEAGHALELIADEFERVLAVLGIIAHDIEMPAHDGERGAQLVTGVVEELPLPSKADSSRSSIRLKVSPRWATSSLPLTSILRVRSSSPMPEAVSLSSRIGASTRPATSQPKKPA